MKIHGGDGKIRRFCPECHKLHVASLSKSKGGDVPKEAVNEWLRKFKCSCGYYEGKADKELAKNFKLKKWKKKI